MLLNLFRVRLAELPSETLPVEGVSGTTVLSSKMETASSDATLDADDVRERGIGGISSSSDDAVSKGKRREESTPRGIIRTQVRDGGQLGENASRGIIVRRANLCKGGRGGS